MVHTHHADQTSPLQKVVPSDAIEPKSTPPEAFDRVPVSFFVLENEIEHVRQSGWKGIDHSSGDECARPIGNPPNSGN